MTKFLSAMERFLPAQIMLKIKLLRMVFLYPYHFSHDVATAFSEPVSADEVTALKDGLDTESCVILDRYLALKRLTDEDVFKYFPMVDLRSACSPKHDDLILQQKRIRDCVKNIPALRNCRSEVLQETSLAHGLAVASSKELEYIRNRDFIDAGAYCGESSLLMSEFMPRRIEAFEPVPAYREKMKTVLSQARLNVPVTVHPEALGRFPENRSFGLMISVHLWQRRGMPVPLALQFGFRSGDWMSWLPRGRMLISALSRPTWKGRAEQCYPVCLRLFGNSVLF